MPPGGADGTMTREEAMTMATAKRRYDKAHYDNYLMVMPAGTKAALQQIARDRGHRSLGAYLLALAEQDTGLDLVLRGELPTLKK